MIQGADPSMMSIDISINSAMEDAPILFSGEGIYENSTKPGVMNSLEKAATILEKLVSRLEEWKESLGRPVNW